MSAPNPTQQTNELINLLPNALGTVAVIYCVDNKLVRETIERHLALGFDAVLVVGENQNAEYSHERVINVPIAINDYSDIWPHLNSLCTKLTGHWIYWGYNAEFLYYPFCETRSIKDLAIFLNEERRETLFGMVIDLYSMEKINEDANYNPQNAGFDAINYFSEPLAPSLFPESADVDENRIISVHGGLKWRFSEWFKDRNATASRVPFFYLNGNLDFNAQGQTDDPEFYSFCCPHHRNPTGAVMSFRTAIDLRHNPASRQKIQEFAWVGTETFAWNSPQLLRLGIIETGQWF